jgi:hypothetical protein
MWRSGRTFPYLCCRLAVGVAVFPLLLLLLLFNTTIHYATSATGYLNGLSIKHLLVADAFVNLPPCRHLASPGTRNLFFETPFPDRLASRLRFPRDPFSIQLSLYGDARLVTGTTYATF